MHTQIFYSLLSVIVVSLLSLIGVLVLWIKEGTLKKILLYFVGFSAGALMGDVFLHLLPEAAEEGFGLKVALYVITGIVFSFIVEKVVHWHHCHNMDCRVNRKNIKSLAYMNLIGDGVHNFIDGMIIAGSYLVSFPVGIATTMAVIFHEIPQELGDFGVLLYSGFKKKMALLFNFLSALCAVLGALTVFLIQKDLTSFLIPFAAGTFLYIAGSDLIPELHEETMLGKSIAQIGVFLLGVLVMAGLLLLE
ncbi:MAG TPA: ZIP family metal transporter [Candidatus Nanoarchaeia archaeon]|nr:ZIP family metal transporter [Candidatus Nanoarchaeia archaeon]